MRFSSSTIGFALAGVAAVALCTPSSAFTPTPSFVRTPSVSTSQQKDRHVATCPCPSCSKNDRSGFTHLYSDVTAEVPADVEAMDGVESTQEAHNVERPARESLKKKRAPKGKPLTEFSVGQTLPATVRSTTTFGAFCDFGATSDGLVHISRLSDSFVKDVKAVVTLGQEVQVRIVSIDAEKGQVALSMITEAQEAASAAPAKEQSKRQAQGGSRDRKSDDILLSKIAEAGWDASAMVDADVISTVSFGAFVKVDARSLAEGMEGSIEGLLHISELTAGRADSVEQYAKAGQKIKVRLLSVEGGKASFTMMSEADVQAARESRGKSKEEPVFEGAEDWQQQLNARMANMKPFFNGPAVVIDKRKN